jgi:thiol-disulfide isomerase/thioredoxin
MRYVNFCLIAIFSLVLSSGSVKDATPSIGYYPGEVIPDIILTDVEGDSYKISDYKGKKVVVNFWASYDAQSRATNVLLYNYLKMNDADATFISVSFDKNKDVIKRTFEMDNLEGISQFCEIDGADSEIYNDFKLNRGFRNYLIDENGVIKAMNFTPDELRSLI